MRVMTATKDGSPEVLQLKELEKPTPKDNEVCIKLHATAVNASDSRVRSFMVSPLFRLPGRIAPAFRKPRYPTFAVELSGEVEAVGKDVKRFKVGDQVVASISEENFGAHAGYKCLPEDGAVVTKASKRKTSSSNADWPVIAALLVLSAVPFIAGAFRLVGLASGAEITPENARFFVDPVPVVIHIVSASLFSVLGAFQFAPGFRRRRPGWHRVAGRLLVVCGLAAALSGLWMTQFYPLHPHLQDNLLYGFRLLFGSAMIVSIIMGLFTVLRRDFSQHRAWMIRGYALGQGAGTQVVTLGLWMVILGEPSGLGRALLMGAGWVINIVVAERIIRSNRSTRHQRPKGDARVEHAVART